MNLWNNRLASVIARPLTARTFSAYNVCIDAIIHFKPCDLARLLPIVGDVVLADEVKPQLVDTPAQFLSVLLSSLRLGKSLQCILPDHLAVWFDENFPDRREEVGGQAGIIANLMASLQTESILYSPMMSPRQASFFLDGVRCPVISKTGLTLEKVNKAAESLQTKVNYVFEYSKGDEFHLGGTTIVVPRANRVIFATRPTGLTLGFNAKYSPYMHQLAQFIDVGFIAGYHNVAAVMPDGRTAKEYMDDEAAHLAAMKSANPNLQFHLEYVTPKSIEQELAMLRCATKHIKSFGINENEIKLVLDRLGRSDELAALKEKESAVTLYLAGLALLDALGVDRIHIHNLGYYVMVCRKTASTSRMMMDAQVDGCLYATAAVSVKAMFGGFATPVKLHETTSLALSEIGFTQMRNFAQHMGLGESFVDSGIYEQPNHYAIVTPAFIVDKPVTTVGMGDTISSTSFAYETSMVKSSCTNRI